MSISSQQLKLISNNYIYTEKYKYIADIGIFYKISGVIFMDKVDAWMTKKVITVTGNQTITVAAKEMTKNNISCLVVAENKKPTGIITQKDILTKVIAMDKDPAKVKVKDVATLNIVTINSDENVAQASNLMALAKIKQIPVLKNGKLNGIITSTDIMRAIRVMKEDLLKIY